MLIRVAATVLLALCFVASCKTLKATTGGPMRYKSEVSACLLEVKREIEEKGEVSEPSYTKLSNIITKWQEEMSNKQSYINLVEMKGHIDTARAEPGNAFREYQEAGGLLTRALDNLKTEVQAP